MASHQTGAIVQKDGRTFAVVTRIPAGVVSPEMLEKIASVARRYHVPLVKLTSGQRILLCGIQERDLEAVWSELQASGQREFAPCVRYVQACVGSETCKYGVLDSLEVALTLEQQYQGMVFPAKLKIGVSGCLRSCSESYLRDIGLIGTRKGWIVTFGGNSGRRPEIGIKVAEGLSQADALDLVQRLLEYYREHAQPKERTGRFLERIGFEMLMSDLLNQLPYIRLDTV